ncbi:AMP-binding protein [Thermodesulfobacteriota bacterium]
MKLVKKTIGQMLNEIAKRYPTRDALIHMEAGVRYNYSLFIWEIDRAARGMIHLGIQKGDRVALWAPNAPEWVVTQIALSKIGAILVPLDPGASKEDLRYILTQSESRAIVLAPGVEESEYVEALFEIRGDLKDLEQVVVLGEESSPDWMSWSELTSLGDQMDQKVLLERENGVSPEDSVAIMYTSGTTGKPKGVVLDHLGLINKSLHSTKRQGLDHQDKLCLFFPLFHMFGNTCICLAGLLRGAAMVMPCNIFDPIKILEAIPRENCTAIYGSPSMMIALLEHPNFQKARWKSLVRGIIGGSPCPMELMKKIVEEVGISEITVSYGITETSSWITMTRPHDPIELRVSTIGTPLECNEVKIVDPDTGEDLPANGQGELCTRGFLMKEYYKLPAATAAAIDKDGWFHSGDLGVMDETGYVKITGRLKDVIVRDGIDIYPTELEEILYGIPQISEVQVFGFPHPEKGQEVAAWVKLKDGAELAIEDMSRYAEEHMEKEKKPGHFRFVTDFPMTRSGKIQKFRLAAMAEKEYA